MTSVAAIGVSINALIGARQSPNRMPASIALASADGIAATARPNGLTSPAAPSKTPTTRNAPVAAANPPVAAPVAASSAAPGVDQAAEIGMRNQRLSTMPAIPIAIESAIKPDAACASLAPTRRQALQDDREGTGEADESGSDAGRDGREKQGLGHAVGRVFGGSGNRSDASLAR